MNKHYIHDPIQRRIQNPVTKIMTRKYFSPIMTGNMTNILVEWQSAFLSIALELNHFTKIFNLESFWRKV